MNYIFRTIIIYLSLLPVIVFAENKQCKVLDNFTKLETKLDLNKIQLPSASNGKTESIINYLKKVSMINFWASWCAPCQKELPILDKVGETEDYNVVTINLSDKINIINRVFKELDIKNLPSFRLPDYKIIKEYNLSGLPATIVITQDQDYVSLGMLKQDSNEIRNWLSCLSK